MSSEANPKPQQIGNYDLISKIAEGGMGAVYKGRSRATGHIVAIKIIPTETARNPVLLRRFEQEFKAASQIDHPNVVKAVDYCGTGPSPFLVMEFVDGESLGQRVERDGPVPEAEAVRLISQVCEGLHRAHKQGLIHRDVKPDNILVTHDGGVAKITDLGLVKDVEGEMNLTRTGRGLGTPHFMAPEQFRNAKNADVRCDVYSLGATLYTMLTGVVPFAKTSPLDCWMKKTKDDFPEPRQLNPKLSERVNWAVCRSMRAEATARPASCREFMEDLTGGVWKAGSGLIPTPAAGAGDSAKIGAEDMWYMVYRDETGQPRTVKGTTDSIRKNVQAGALGDVDAILIGRTKGSQFQPLKVIPEFRDLVVSPSGLFPPTPPASGATAVPGGPGGSGVRPTGRTPTRLPTPGSGVSRVPTPPPASVPSSARTPATPRSSGQLPRPSRSSAAEPAPTLDDNGARDPLPPLPGSGLYSAFQQPAGGKAKADMTPYIIAAIAVAAGLAGGYFLFGAK